MPDRILERAFALARSGECRSLDELRAALRRENFLKIDEHLGGPTIKGQLKALIEAALPRE